MIKHMIVLQSPMPIGMGHNHPTQPFGSKGHCSMVSAAAFCTAEL